MKPPAPSILVVDDEEDTCANLRDILTDLGYHVDVACDGPSALKLVEQNPYDLALLDLKMPGMDGLELYRRIKETRAGTVAIIVTAYAATDTARDARQAGAFEILPKPVDFSRLLNLVDQVLEQPLVLVVDDDRELCSNLWDLFRERGCRVCVAHTIHEARQRLEGRDYRLVLIDMKLKDGDGSEVFRLVHKMAPTARTMLITGFPSETNQVVRQALDEGADAVCYKPFDVERLLTTVRSLIEEK
jgi:DNA-binding NtrC family response regulator